MKIIAKKLKIRWGWLLFTSGLFVLMACACLYFQRDFYVHATENWYRKRIVVYLLPMLLSIICSQIRPCLSAKWKAGSRAAFVMLSIVLSEVAFQSLCWDTLWNGLGIQMRADCLLLNLSLTAVVFTAVWLVVWDSRRAALTTYWLMGIMGYAYRCVFDFRGAIFRINDLLSIHTALQVIDRYTYHLRASHVFWIACGILLWMISLWVPHHKVRTRKMKLAKCAAVLTAVVWTAILLGSPMLENMQISTNAWQSSAIWNNGRQGVLVTLMKEIKDASKIRPKDYRAEELFQDCASLNEPGFLRQTDERPNVIVIMNEALTDFNSLWEVETQQDAFPFLHSLKGKSVYGNVYVSSYGGETCNTEHSFLTGTIPVPNLPVPLLSTVQENTPSLAWQLKALGYRTIAIHPEDPENYRRDKCYPMLGIDEFVSEATFENVPKLREVGVGDQECYEKLISLYEQKEANERLFLYTVTMQNHSPYDTGLLEEKILLSQEQSNSQLQEYLNCVRLSDQAFEELVSYFEAEEEPTIILMFGDHQPSIDMSTWEKREDLSDTEQRFTQYITPFMIWANYPIENRHVESLSVNYLSALLLETAGLPLTGYDEWLLETAQKYPVVNLYGWGDAQGQSALWDSDSKNWPEELQQLNHLRYNRLYDAQNRLPALRIPE